MRLRTRDVAARTLDGETIILDLRDSRYLSVTGVGTRIVEMLADDTTLEDMVDVLADEYEADPAVVRTDAERFLGKLDAAGLLER